MREELRGIWSAIETEDLSSEFSAILGANWSHDDCRFHSQETYLIDFKDRAPKKLSEDYGIAIIRLAIAFHNTFGGIIVFGVDDETFGLSKLDIALNVEAFNNELKRVIGRAVECQLKIFAVPNSESQVSVLLVPKRRHKAPARSKVALGKYPANVLWVRDRHEVVQASAAHFSLLYSDRSALPGESDVQRALPIHKSLPPSPATMHEFLGRDNLMAQMWDWLVFSDRPRLYVHGPGGSGKSTLAHEFARTIAEYGFRIQLALDERVDYVLYLSAKETEFNPLSATQQDFSLRQFTDAESQFRQVLFHSGHSDEASLESVDAEELASMLGDLFSSYTGLIVLDDIDALSRRGANTGEESLFLMAARSNKKTKILYTLRFPPAHAANSGIAVPGLSEVEYYDFVSLCCSQFEVKEPHGEELPILQEQTNGLPLLIETVIGLRRYTGNYREAVKQFGERGGDDARRYLYQREYDVLRRDGKARELLAALSLLQEPVDFSVIHALLGYPPSLIKEALSECGTIFISTSDAKGGETQYQLHSPCVPFVKNVSQRLPKFEQIRRKIELYRRSGSNLTPREAGLLYQMQKLFRMEQFEAAVGVFDNVDPDDPSLANPQIRSLLGQAMVNAGPKYFERARESFAFAESLGHRDTQMMRAWYFLEMRSGYGHEAAKSICARMFSRENSTPRVKSEFIGKHARCVFEQANSHANVNREKAVPLYRQAIEEYLHSLRFAESDPNMSIVETLGWIQRPIRAMLRTSGEDIVPYLKIIEDFPKDHGDIPLEGAKSLLSGLAEAYIPNDIRTRQKTSGLLRRTIDRLERLSTDDPTPGADYLIDMLSEVYKRYR